MHHRPRLPGNGWCSLAWRAPAEAAQRAVHIGVGHVHHILRRSGYAEIYRQQAPQWASMAFLQGNIAWATQARAQDEDPNSLREALRNALIRPTGHTPMRYSPGTRLVREWQGDVYEVTILPKGYLWQGRIYRSLSGIAQEITGAKWSGPRFFGLKTPAS